MMNWSNFQANAKGKETKSKKMKRHRKMHGNHFDIFSSGYFFKSIFFSFARHQRKLIVCVCSAYIGRNYQRYFNLMHFILRFHAHSFIHWHLPCMASTITWISSLQTGSHTPTHLSKCMRTHTVIFNIFQPFLFVIFWLNVDVEVTDWTQNVYSVLCFAGVSFFLFAHS